MEKTGNSLFEIIKKTWNQHLDIGNKFQIVVGDAIENASENDKKKFFVLTPKIAGIIMRTRNGKVDEFNFYKLVLRNNANTYLPRYLQKMIEDLGSEEKLGSKIRETLRDLCRPNKRMYLLSDEFSRIQNLSDKELGRKINEVIDSHEKGKIHLSLDKNLPK